MALVAQESCTAPSLEKPKSPIELDVLRKHRGIYEKVHVLYKQEYLKPVGPSDAKLTIETADSVGFCWTAESFLVTSCDLCGLCCSDAAQVLFHLAKRLRL